MGALCLDRYNYTGTLYFDVNKNRSFKSIVSTAKDIVNEVLPIQCLEAVFLGAYLTANAPELERFPISFKTVAGGSVHRHIILAVRHQHAKWGALGLSRSEKLMFKELKYASLSELIQDFRKEFEQLFHSVLKVYVGFPFSHDIHSSEKVEWRMMNVSLENAKWTEVAQHFDTFSKEALDILAFKRAKGVLPDSFALKFPLHMPETEPGRKSSDKRLHLNAGSFEFPGAFDDDDSMLLPPAAETLKGGSSPGKDGNKAPKPILIAPDRLEFKQALAVRTNLLSLFAWMCSSSCAHSHPSHHLTRDWVYHSCRTRHRCCRPTSFSRTRRRLRTLLTSRSIQGSSRS